MDVSLIIGFIMGLITSGLIVIWYDKTTSPKLVVIVDSDGPAKGQKSGEAPHAFYHLKVRNEGARWPLYARRPAWSCKTTIEVVDDKGRSLLPEPIIARWTSQPEPLLPVVDRGNVLNVLDPARFMAARKIDVHCHEDQQFSVALKFQGNTDCHLFSNESYLHTNWQNPTWALSPGEHSLRITVYYESGRAIVYFQLRNPGTDLDQVALIPSGHKGA
jgi:hypothetical protein